MTAIHLPTWRARLLLSILLMVPVIVVALVLRNGAAETPPALDVQIGKYGRPLLVPVTLEDGRRVQFLLDTGAAMSVFDSSLQKRSDQIVGKTVFSTSAGMCSVVTYRCPAAKIGSLALDGVDRIVFLDLEGVRMASGEDVYGLLGMDFLRRFALEVDFDEGHLRLWNAMPDRRCRDYKEVPLTTLHGCPHTEVVLPNAGSESFILDTGANASTVNGNVFDLLVSGGHMDVYAPQSAVTATGHVHGITGVIKTIQFASFDHSHIRMDRDPISVLGLRYLSRYRLLLDFPNSVAYVAKGEHFTIQDSTATSGLSILEIDGQKVVRRVYPNSPADLSGVKEGDILETVNGVSIAELDMFDLGNFLTSGPGNQVRIELRHGDERRSVSLRLAARQRVTKISLAEESIYR